jgi:hypothetical protein
MKKTEGQKSRATVPLKRHSHEEVCEIIALNGSLTQNYGPLISSRKVAIFYLMFAVDTGIL